MRYILTYDKDGEKLVLSDQYGTPTYFNSIETAKQAQQSFKDVGYEMNIEETQ